MTLGGSVTELATRRQRDDVVNSITFVFEGVHYGTFAVRARYAAGKPIVLYVVPAGEAENAGGTSFHGPVDCLVTDDVTLALGREALG
jgi:hypothetical protein